MALKIIDPFVGRTSNGMKLVLCICDCGNEKIIRENSVKSGRTLSCGCLRIKQLTKHGLTPYNGPHHPLHGVWSKMKSRCNNPNDKSYKDYGARDIFVCDEWENDFKSFYDWAVSSGYKRGVTIERLDVDGPYSPENCTWIKKGDQMRNRTNSIYLTAFGETKQLNFWAEDLRCPSQDAAKIRQRIYRNHWDHERAITTP